MQPTFVSDVEHPLPDTQKIFVTNSFICILVQRQKSKFINLKRKIVIYIFGIIESGAFLSTVVNTWIAWITRCFWQSKGRNKASISGLYLAIRWMQVAAEMLRQSAFIIPVCTGNVKFEYE
jgi:hypothetical protein